MHLGTDGTVFLKKKIYKDGKNEKTPQIVNKNLMSQLQQALIPLEADVWKTWSIRQQAFTAMPGESAVLV